MAKNKERLDKILVDKGFFETKSKAQGAIMAGDVKINDEVITKAAGAEGKHKDRNKIAPVCVKRRAEIGQSCTRI